MNTIKKSLVFCLLLSFLSAINCHVQAVPPPLQIVHVIGDSHSSEFSKIPGCVIHWLGPITMHRVGRDGLSFVNLRNLGVLEGQAVVFSFGEIDARCHIGKQCDLNNRNLDEVIDTLATKYIQTILQNRQLYTRLTCIVYSVTPPTNIAYNPQFPYYGTLAERVMISRKLNMKLAILCQQFGLSFLNVYNEYANPDGTLKTIYSDGCVHIHPNYNVPIVQKLRQILRTHAN